MGVPSSDVTSDINGKLGVMRVVTHHRFIGSEILKIFFSFYVEWKSILSIINATKIFLGY